MSNYAMNLSSVNEDVPAHELKAAVSTRSQYENQNNPIISIDIKKKEMIGNFANKGKTWAVDGIATYDHDFRTYASGIAIPFGIYDCIKNIGRVFVGTSYDTAEFEVDSLVKWWLWYGKCIFRKTSATGTISR